MTGTFPLIANDDEGCLSLLLTVSVIPLPLFFYLLKVVLERSWFSACSITAVVGTLILRGAIPVLCRAFDFLSELLNDVPSDRQSALILNIFPALLIVGVGVAQNYPAWGAALLLGSGVWTAEMTMRWELFSKTERILPWVINPGLWMFVFGVWSLVRAVRDSRQDRGKKERIVSDAAEID